MNEWTDKQRKRAAEMEYKELRLGKGYKVDSHKLGTVVEVHSHTKDSTGLDAYVLDNSDSQGKHHYTILYQGSSQRETDWIQADAGQVVHDFHLDDVANALNRSTASQSYDVKGMQGAYDVHAPAISDQAKAASKLLNKYLADPNADVTVYGHSLGSMNGQYAVANASDPNRVVSAYLYEGPNIYNDLSQTQKKQADMLTMRGVVHNYVDEKDVVPYGYKSGKAAAVGEVHIIDSIWAKTDNPKDWIANQHMWGGYQFDKNGKLKVQAGPSAVQTTNIAERSLQALAQHKCEYSHGGFTDAEKLQLDEELATILSKSYARVGETAVDGIAQTDSTVKTELEKLKVATTQVPWFAQGTLSSSEVSELYSEGKVGSSDIADTLTVLSGYKTTLEKLNTRLNTLSTDIDNFIVQVNSEDMTLAQAAEKLHDE
ncbi:hypothetical protein ACFQY8_00305 [Alloscardovia venturai]|uniref:Triacylglycerol lipase n=1 Tax=Alloscardovia venturai TaxID=1769421 RepID=A0ABW2Y4D1_9BIFI